MVGLNSHRCTGRQISLGRNSKGFDFSGWIWNVREYWRILLRVNFIWHEHVVRIDRHIDIEGDVEF